MLQEFSADLHIHTCLSPCASLDLSPIKIVEQAMMEGLDIIAITDHNTAKNVQAVMRLGEKRGLKVIPGLEIQSREEVHLLTLFPDWPSTAAWAETVFQNLPDVPNEPEFFGDQPIVDKEGIILGFEERLLINSLNLSLEDIIHRVQEQGGVTIPSHYDRDSFSLISQLGFIPPHLPLEAIEMGHRPHARRGEDSMAGDRSIPRIASSDAHQLADIGNARTILLLAAATLGELRMAFREQQGRRIVNYAYKSLDPA